MKRIGLKTLGCKVNTYETEAVFEKFKKAGYTKVNFDEEADIYIINTCSVTNTGDKKSRQAVRKCIRQNPDAIIIVMGCYAQLQPKEVMEIEGVDIVLGTQGREKILEYVEKYQKERQPITKVTNIMKQKTFEDMNIVGFENQTRAFIKIQEGCNNFCTFCIIPWARGLIRSQEPHKIIEEVQNLVNNGIKEIVLTGIHTGGYGEDLENYNLVSLLNELDKIDKLERIRISSIEMSQVDEEMIAMMKKSHKIVEHLHIPIQAGSNEILQKMRRNYTLEEFKNKIKEIRNIFPDIALTTDIIVGFPGETEELFEETLKTLDEIEFSELHVFPYSIRNGTPAAKMENQISESIKKERVHKLLEINREKAEKYSKKYIGEIVSVLIERINKNGNLEGHTSNYLKVEILEEGINKKDNINKIRDVIIEEVKYPICRGKLLK